MHALMLVMCCVVASTLGATFVFPGPHHVSAGGTNPSPPYLTGLGAVSIAWILAPLVTMCNAVPVYLLNRKALFRSEDPFHKALWVCCRQKHIVELCALYIVYFAQCELQCMLDATCCTCMSQRCCISAKSAL